MNNRVRHDAAGGQRIEIGNVHIPFDPASHATGFSLWRRPMSMSNAKEIRSGARQTARHILTDEAMGAGQNDSHIDLRRDASRNSVS